MNRRGFLEVILAAAAAPAFVKAGSLMPLWVPKQEIWVSTLDVYEEGVFSGSAEGHYTRIGNTVFFTAKIKLGALASGHFFLKDGSTPLTTEHLLDHVRKGSEGPSLGNAYHSPDDREDRSYGWKPVS